MFDIIGDIHGHAKELRVLLESMGYSEREGCYRHPERQVIFVGDLVDRGPEINETLAIVKAMHDREQALVVMGNHEFNALSFHTPDPQRDGGFLRRHSKKNLQQIRETVTQIPADDLNVYLDWFCELPFCLELDDLRVVHACWDSSQIELLHKKRDSHGGVNASFLAEANEPSTDLFRAVDDVLKGKDIPLPPGMSYFDKEGNARRRMRIQWYRKPGDETYPSYSLGAAEGIPDVPVPAEHLEQSQPYSPDAKPVFFGHYWLAAKTPTRLASNVACLDYSIAKAGKLVAYRWAAEQELQNDHFCHVNYLER